MTARRSAIAKLHLASHQTLSRGCKRLCLPFDRLNCGADEEGTVRVPHRLHPPLFQVHTGVFSLHTTTPFNNEVSCSIHDQKTMDAGTLTAFGHVISMLSPEQTSLHRFHEHLTISTSIVALVGAGLSAASGLSTFQGIGGLWRSYDPDALATPEAFSCNPELIWQFYSHRRHRAMLAQPNLAHHALAEASRRRPGLLTLSQNIDDLSERAGHPEEQILHLHGSLFRVQCVDNQNCGYSISGTAENSQMQQDQDISGLYTSPDPPSQTLPTCPNCHKLLRPGVVWFGEPLPREVLAGIRNWFDSCAKVDLMLVIGTSAQVYPAAGYINVARLKGARICVVNTDRDHEFNGDLHEDDWFFQGDAAEILPTLLQQFLGLQGFTESM